MQEIVATLENLCDRTSSLEAVVQKLVSQTMTKEERNALRRQYYRQARDAELKDRLVLPDRHVLTAGDDRLEKFHGAWAEVGMRFGKLDQPEHSHLVRARVELLHLPQEADHVQRLLL